MHHIRISFKVFLSFSGLTESKLYKPSIEHDQRCVIVSDGFYEWQRPVFPTLEFWKQPDFFQKKSHPNLHIEKLINTFLTVFDNEIGYFQYVRVGNTDKGRKRRLAVPDLEVELNSLIWCMQSKKKTTQMTTRRLIPLWCHWPWSVQISVANCVPKNSKNWPRTG